MTYQELAKAMAAMVKDYVRADRAGFEMRLAVAEAQLAAIDKRVQDDSLTKALGTLQERVAVVEVLKSIPGPAGEKGVDGLGFEDLDVSLDGDRTLVFRFAKGDQEKTFRVVVGWPVYQKNWIQGKAYVPGDVVTWDGSEWNCLEATNDQQPGLSTVWYRSVTKGRAGAPGRDGRDWTPPPVVQVGAVK